MGTYRTIDSRPDITYGMYILISNEKIPYNIFVIFDPSVKTVDGVDELADCIKYTENEIAEAIESMNLNTKDSHENLNLMELIVRIVRESILRLDLECCKKGCKVIAANKQQDDSFAKAARKSGKEQQSGNRNIDDPIVQFVLNNLIDDCIVAINDLYESGYVHEKYDGQFTEWLKEKATSGRTGPVKKISHWHPIRGEGGGLPEIGGNYRVTIKGQRKGDLTTEVCFFDDTEKWFWTSKIGRVTAWEDIDYDDEPYVEP